jgi:DNA repair protein RadC
MLIFNQREERAMSEYRLRMKELPATDQPRERLLTVGPAALGDAELLAILLRVDFENRLMMRGKPI